MANPVLFASGTQLAIVTTEHILSAPAVAGTFTFHVDTINMAVNDVLELRAYQKTLTGGIIRVAYFMTYYGAQPTYDVEKISVPIGNDLVEANALNFTLLQTFGVGKNFPWKVLQYT